MPGCVTEHDYENWDRSLWRLAVDAVQVDVGDQSVVVERGDSVGHLPIGAFASLHQASKLRLHSDDDPMLAAASAGDQQSDEDHAELAVGDLGLGAAVVFALKDAGLETVESVLAFAEENDGLQSIDGIGPKVESDIQSAIEKLLS